MLRIILGLDYATACLELHRTIAELRAHAEPGRPPVSPAAETVRPLPGSGRKLE